MGKTLLLILCLAPCLLTAQTVDSVAIRQVDSLIQVSSALTGKREFDKALEIGAAAEKLALEKLGQESAAYGSCCFNHGRILYLKRDYTGAEKWYLESKVIREKVLGREHLDYAVTLNSLAILYRIMGQYDKAEPLYFESKAIREKVLGREHPDYASSLNGLAVLYQEMAQLDKAEPLYLESKAIREKALGREHPDYATSLNNMGALYQRMGQYDKSESLYLESKTIREKVLGKEHSDYAQTLNNLAILYSVTGQYDKAEPVFLEAIAIRGITQGREHPDYAQSLYNLALLYEEMGQYEKAEPPYLEAKTIWGKALGREHPDYAANLSRLVRLYQDMGQYEKVEPLLFELSSVNRRIIERAIHHLSESELNDFLDKFSNNSLSQNQTLSFTQIAGSKKMIPVCYDNSLFYKGFLLQSVGRIKQLALSDEGTAEKYTLLKDYHRRLATQYAQPIAKRDSTLVAQLEVKANDLEKDLARTVAGWGQANKQVTWQEVQAALKPGEVAVEFVTYRFYQKKQTDSTMYAALILLPLPAGASAEAGRAEIPQFIPLFEEREIATLFKNKGARKSDYVNTLYANSDQMTGKQKNLYQAIWQPLENALAGAKTVYFSPAGLLHRINFKAIPGQDGKPLADRLNLVQLGSTRQIALPQPLANATLSPEAMLFGGIDYEPDSLNKSPALIPQDYASTRGDISFENVDSTLRGGVWGYLPWTEKEVNSLQIILKQSGLRPVLYKGAEGSEEALKSIGAEGTSPRVLHLATHGFFFPDPKRLSQQAATDASAFKRAEHPMIRSGLILAGGNYTWKTGKPFRPDREDGVVTAYEISQMNLSNTELVVLSACETGLGDIEGNEGVYGLQRALKIAGAHYIVMSLWQVPDAQTQELMTAFYTNWFSRKMPIPEAFDAAQKAMREKYEHPFFWAGFILLR